jgi:hypothetical protein
VQARTPPQIQTLQGKPGAWLSLCVDCVWTVCVDCVWTCITNQVHGCHCVWTVCVCVDCVWTCITNQVHGCHCVDLHHK